MDLFPVGSCLVLSSLLIAAPLCAQNAPSSPVPSNASAQSDAGQTPAAIEPSGPVAADAPRMTKQTRYEIIKDFETQIVYSRTAFPMGARGLNLRNGVVSPQGQELQQLLTIWGPSIKPGDPAHISYVRIKDDHIHFDLNGGPVHRKKWYQHIQVAGANGTPVPLSNDQSTDNPHGSYLDVYFDKYVPEMSAAQLRALLLPVLDFKARSKEEAYLDTVPPKAKEAIQAHHVLVGMNTEMVIHAVGKPPKKVRERDGETDYEEWIYGQAPQDVDFVRIIGDEVVRIETMKVGGQKILRAEKEVIIEKPDKDTEAKREQEDRPANAPSLRRPGEDTEDVPKPSDSISPMPPAAPPDVSQPGPPGPGEIIAGGR
jgi:hypothetical protein